MKKYNEYFTKEKYKKHLLWLKGEKGGERLDLSNMNLSDLDLSGKKLSEVIFRGANLSYANLRGADLSWADLRRANLEEANLTRAILIHADLSWADLSKAILIKADLRQADLSGVCFDDVKIKNTIFPDYLSKIKQDDNLIKKIADIVLKDYKKINMRQWHTCDTTHCLAGWAIHLTDNYEAEKKSSASLVGRLLLGDEVSKMFYVNNEEVIEYLRSIKNGKQINKLSKVAK